MGGAPGPVRFARAWQTAAGLGAGQSLLLLLAVTAAGIVTMPLQRPLIGWLEGSWPGLLGPLAAWRSSYHRWRRGELVTRPPEAGAEDPAILRRRTQRWSERGHWQRLRYPTDDHLIRPTALGNALTAALSRVRKRYDLDGQEAWLLLEPLLSGRIATTVSEQRDAMDAAARMSVTAALCVPPTLWLLWRSGWWLLLAVFLAAVSRLAYVAAVHAAVTYGQYVTAAFDLHRFDLLTALHLSLPEDASQERRTYQDLGAVWRGVRLDRRYEHPSGDRPPASPGTG